jgi:hypothetical protein
MQSYTTGQIAAMYRVADWQARRAVDAIGKPIPRAGLYRLVPSEMLGELEEELRRRGWLPTQEGTSAR